MRVALLVTCINDAMYPDTGKAVVTLLRRLGVEVDFPTAQTCCAQPMVNTGYLDEAVPVVRTFVDAFAGYDAIVTPSGSCAGSARHQHSIVARRSGDPGLVAAVAETGPRTYELSEFLVDVLGVTDVGAYFPHRVTYHPTCHSLRMLGVGDRPRQLLEKRARADPRRLAAGRGVLRLRWDVRGEERRHVRGDGIRQGAPRARDGSRDGGGRRQLVPHAHRRAALARALRRPHRAPRRDPRRHRGHRVPLRRTGSRRPAGDWHDGHLRRHAGLPRGRRAALGDTQLRHNLAHATRTIRDKRARVVAEVEDWEELRVAGAAVKEAALRDLATHLEQLEASLTAGGATVHWARDAAEACEIVAQVARSHGVDEVVKVKSMATQEIGLNEVLEAEGIAAWETDLAELIVQLGDDLPSHILVPAIHRNRAEIREIFRRRMADVGRPAPDDLTDEPAVLAAAARAHLREKFLRAKVGVSGANFAVAETGTLVVVESEGNGRMCLTLPEVLVSVVGIEKVVPTWRDLDPLPPAAAALLDRGADEPLHLHLDRGTPGDGPQEVHVVLLDNGRTNALADDVGRQALRCIRCSACLNVCPVYERVGGHAYGSVYPGPIGAILNPLLNGVSDEQTRRCPTPPRCAAPASRSARCSSTSPRCWSTCARRSSTATAATPCPSPRRSR